MINVFQPACGSDELDAVRSVFDSNWLGRGSVTALFEEEFAQHLGVERNKVTSIACCTEGLFQAIELLGFGAGDEVVLPTISFVGAGNAIAHGGAKPVFCDVDSRTLNPTAATISAAVTPKTRAVMLLHYGGLPCEMTEIMDLAKDNGLAVIEDSACSVASSVAGRSCGTFGDVSAWSFDAMKILVTGDGGMLYCADEELLDRASKSIYLGLTTASGLASSESKRWWEFEISGFGRRAIMNDVSSAIGRVQLKKLASFVERRRSIHEFYDAVFANVTWLETPPPMPDEVSSSYYLYWIQTESSVRDDLAVYLRSKDIYTTFRYHPLHLVKHYGSEATCPSAESAAERSLCLPIHQSLSDADVERVIGEVRNFGSRL